MNVKQLLPKLRHERWMGWTQVAGRRLVEMPVFGLPRVALGEDTPERFSFITKTGLLSDDWQGHSFGEWEAIAVSNLARRPRRWQVKEHSGGVLGFGAKPSRLEYFDEFACEQVLDAAFMNEAHALLSSPLLVVAIPVRGILAVADGKDQAQVGKIIDYAHRGFVGAPEGLEPLTPHAITIQDGRPAGIVQGTRSGMPEIDRQHIEPERGFPWPAQDAGASGADD